MLALGAIGLLTKPTIFRGINGVPLSISKPMDQVIPVGAAAALQSFQQRLDRARANGEINPDFLDYITSLTSTIVTEHETDFQDWTAEREALLVEVDAQKLKHESCAQKHIQLESSFKDAQRDIEVCRDDKEVLKGKNIQCENEKDEVVEIIHEYLELKRKMDDIEDKYPRAGKTSQNIRFA
ncbi:hypothetical protein EJ07DRAFT_152989 [Lizonia empirigonia]|nr:hypothetical protein EJ07DRAFT_152989 [Lizonia empirigonia]